jgi:hypothetical protein
MLEEVILSVIAVVLVREFEFDRATHWTSPDSSALTLGRQALESGHADVKNLSVLDAGVTGR